MYIYVCIILAKEVGKGFDFVWRLWTSWTGIWSMELWDKRCHILKWTRKILVLRKATVTTQMIFVFLKKEIPNVVYSGNAALLNVIVTWVSTFSVSRLASWRAYLVLFHSQPAETCAYTTYIDINSYFYLFTWITFALNVINFVPLYTDTHVYSKFSVNQWCNFTLKPKFFSKWHFVFPVSPSTFLTVLFQLKIKNFHSLVRLTKGPKPLPL